MARQRKDEFVYEIEVDQTAFGTAAAFGGSQLVGSIASVDLATAAAAEVDEPSYVVDGGTHESIVGTAYGNVSIPLSVKMEGTQAVATDGNPAVATAQARLISSCMGQETKLTTRGNATGTPTTIEVIEDNDDGHIPGAGTGTIGLAAFARAASSTIKVRPYTYDASTETHDLLMPLPLAPAAGDDIYAGCLTQFVQQPTYSGTPAVSYSMRFIGNDTTQNRQLTGVVSTIEVPEFGPSDVPMLNATLSAASVSRAYGSDTATATTPRGRVFAGGEVLLGAYADKGSATAAYSCPAARVAFTVGQGFLPYENPNATTGISGWDRAKGSISVTLTIPHDVIPTTVSGTLTSATWYDAWTTGGAESKFHLLVSCGQSTAGYSQAWYFPALRLMRPDDGEVNEQDARVLRFMCATPLAATEHPAINLMW